MTGISRAPSVSPEHSLGGLEKFPDNTRVTVQPLDPDVASADTTDPAPLPLKWKIASVVMVSAIGFGSHWSSGIAGAMKATIKKELHINNVQFSLLSGTEDFTTTVLMLLTGLVTDRIGGAGAIFYGNILYTIGSILVAASATVRSYHFMLAANVILALGDIPTQVSQYKIFSSWFPPNHGFASTLGFELGLGKIGGFVGKSTANVISKRLGFAWVFWMAVVMNVFTNIVTLIFYLFTRYTQKMYSPAADPATDGTSVVFTQNATELAEQRFHTDSITAGWYTSVVQYAGFFIAPVLGIVVDLFGKRIYILAVCGTGAFIAMLLLNFASSTKGTAATFGIWAATEPLGTTTLIDSMRTSMWEQSVFGSAYALKLTMNNAMSIITRVVTGVIQDADHNSYHHVTIVYVALASVTMFISILLVSFSFVSPDLGRLVWTRKQRLSRGNLIKEMYEKFHGKDLKRNRMISKLCFVILVVLVLGSWAAYFWGVATGNSD